MTKYFFITVIILVSNIALGQVKLFEPGLISDNHSFGLTVSPNGKELLFVRTSDDRDTALIYYSKKVKDKWQKPTLSFFTDKRYRQIDPAFSHDGQIILFNSLVATENSYDVFIVRKTANQWLTPERLSDSINTTLAEVYATINKQKDIYFSRRSKSFDIYVSQFIDNKYQKAKLLDTTVNTENNEANPYISPDDNFIIFWAEYKDGFGDSDLYISFKKQDKWSYPVNLGNEINSSIGEFCPSIDFKNKLFLFSRTETVNGKRTDNIFSYPLKNLGIRKLKKLAKWDK